MTAKQQKFCDEYFIDLNATAAALRAGYSRETALNGALMRLPKIKLYLQERGDDIAQKVAVTQDMVLRELCKIAFGNIGNYFAADGSLKPMNEVSDDAKAALWSVNIGGGNRVVGDNTNNGDDGNDGTNNKVDNGRPSAGVVKLRMYNKLSALDKIAKYLNFYKPEVKEPKVIHHYLDHDELTEDDKFDDEALKEELRLKKKKEARIERQEARIKMQDKNSRKSVVLSHESRNDDTTNLTDGYNPDAVPLDEDGNVLCDGAGIPYGPLPKALGVAESVVPANSGTPVAEHVAPTILTRLVYREQLFGKMITPEVAAERARDKMLMGLFR